MLATTRAGSALLALSALLLSAAFNASAAANMALVAEPSTSYVSGDTSVTALNDGVAPERSRNRGPGSYGNWPRRETQWVQYTWDKPISTHQVQVQWWDDNQGVRLPSAARVYYWDGDAFKQVEADDQLGTEMDAFNTLSFKEVTTDKLRLEIDGSGEFSTGVLEWRVIDSGNSPNFPPRVTTDADRSVVLSGRTYLNGNVRYLEGKAEGERANRWAKLSGPGEVGFEDASAIDTTATFTRPGDYVLRLSAAVGDNTASDTLRVRVVEAPPVKNLIPVDTRPYTIDSPLWNQRAKALIVSWIPHCIDRINDPDLPEGGINNFVEAAKKLRGEPAENHRGYVFSNAWVYNTMESMCVALMVDAQGDAEVLAAQKHMQQTLDEWIPLVLAAQETDGYLQTCHTLRDWPRWSPRHRTAHEGYVAGYLLDAAVAHYQLTAGEDLRLYNAAKKLADCWADQIGPGEDQQQWWDEHQGMEMALVRFGRFVNTVEGENNGERYIQLAKFLLDCRGGGDEYSQSHVPVVRQYEAVGHAVRASYNYAAMSDVAMETHDPDYQSAVISLFDNMVNRKYYLTGGIGSGETSEGFGPDYSLRHNAYCESCSSAGLLFFEHKLNMAYHDAKFADLYEETLYNALLGSVDLAGENFYYQNPLDARGPRYPWHVCPCCVGNIPRVLLMLPTWAYVKSDDALYVNLFIGSTIDVGQVAGTNVEVVQDTDYPWDGGVELTVNPDQPTTFALHLRVPDREVSELYTASPDANGIDWIKVNGRAVNPQVTNGYAVLVREWAPGDKVSFELPMKVQTVTASDKIQATRGQIALRFGPLIYNFESIDQAVNQPLSPDAELVPHWKPDLLQGVVAIQGQWADGSALLATPYYARFNRMGDQDGGDGQRQRGFSRVWVDRAE